MVYLELRGRIPSKKNSQQIVRIGGFNKLIPSKRYKAAREMFLEQLDTQHYGPTLRGPLRMECRLWGNNEKWVEDENKRVSGSDIDNRLASICDILMDAEIIEDDAGIFEIHARKLLGKHPEWDDWGAVIRISEFDGEVR